MRVLMAVFLVSCLLNDPTSYADFLMNQGWNGDQSLSDPANPDSWSTGFSLIQVVGGKAIFREIHNGLNSFVAIEMSSLRVAQRGADIRKLREYSKGGMACLRFLKKVAGTDNQGFNTTIYNFKAVKCLNQ